jgi:MoxR-like ATPase
MTPSAATSAGLVDRLLGQVVGRRRELELVVAALAADRHIVLEGPPGTGKSTLLRAVARELGIGFEFVEGNAELTPARLVGHFDPARVLTDGYTPEVFVDGPLITAMTEGSLLYVEEINRIPEETLNVLITVMSEQELHVPRLGKVHCAPGFRLVAAMNPFDAVGTARISSAVYDRMCRLSMTYQSAPDEVAIVQQAVAEIAGTGETGETNGTSGTGEVGSTSIDPDWLGKVVELVRRTRDHADLRVGSSVRGAIDIALVVRTLAELRGQSPDQPSVGLDAAIVALSGRVRLREGSQRTSEGIITELWEEIFGRVAGGGDGDGDEGKGGAPIGATNSR